MSDDNVGVTVSLKGHYPVAPWLVFHGADVEGVAIQLRQAFGEGVSEALDAFNLPLAVFQADALYKGAESAMGLTTAPEPAPAPAPTPQAAPAPAPAASGWGAAPASAPAQAAPAYAAQAAPAPSGGHPCPHGERVYKVGISQKTGKEWKAWMCPAPKGTPGQCDPEFIR